MPFIRPSRLVSKVRGMIFCNRIGPCSGRETGRNINVVVVYGIMHFAPLVGSITSTCQCSLVSDMASSLEGIRALDATLC